MAHYIDKDALVAEIEKQRQLIFPKNTGEMKVADVPKPLEHGWLNALSWIKKTIDSLEVKEVDLEKEFDDYIEKQNAFINNDNNEIKYYNGDSFNHVYDIYPIAKHFFELGMVAGNKVQKGE